MRALEVKVDGTTVALAGTPRATKLAVTIFWNAEDDTARFNVAGMSDLGAGRRAHTHWTLLRALPPGSRLTLGLVDAAAAHLPPWIAGTALHGDARIPIEQCGQDVRPGVDGRRAGAPHAALALTLPDGTRTLAGLDDGRSQLACNFSWDATTPDACQVSLSSLSQQEELARAGGRRWAHTLALGEHCLVDVGG